MPKKWTYEQGIGMCRFEGRVGHLTNERAIREEMKALITLRSSLLEQAREVTPQIEILRTELRKFDRQRQKKDPAR